MSRTILLEQIVALELGSEVRERLEKLAKYKASDGFSIDFGFYAYKDDPDDPRDFAISVNIVRQQGEDKTIATYGSFKFDEVPLITAEVARRGDMEIYYRDTEKERLEYLRRLREILVEPFLSPIERHLLETASFDELELTHLDLDQLDLEDWPHEPRDDY